MAAESVHPVPWVFCVSRRGAGSRSSTLPSAKKSTLSFPAAWPPLISTARAPSRLGAHLRLVLRDRLFEQDSRLRQIGREDPGSRNERATQHGDRGARQQLTSGPGDHHRVEHHVFECVTIEPLPHRLDHGRSAEHADLHRTDREIAANCVDLCRNELRRDHLDRGDALRVLRGQRRNRRCAVDAERRERL